MSTTFCRIVRCTEDFTFDLAPEVILLRSVSYHGKADMEEHVLFFEHGSGRVDVSGRVKCFGKKAR